VLAAEHLLDLAGVDQAGKLIEAGRELGPDVLSLAGPFDEHGKILGALAERGDQLDLLLDPAAALEDFLGFGLVVPEIWRRGARLYACELLGRAGGFKDNSGDRTRASRGPDICESVRRSIKPRNPPNTFHVYCTAGARNPASRAAAVKAAQM
jgi:hypothetical protein